jgi:hypothetical protein
MEISKKTFEEKPKDLWKNNIDFQVKAVYIINNYNIIELSNNFSIIYFKKRHVTLSSVGSTTKLEETYKSVVFMEDLEKRKEAYGICGECNEPGTGRDWCKPCNAKRFTENFKNWASGNKAIDEFIQQSQLNAVHRKKYLEWIPFENFQDVTYITRGGFGKINSAKWPEGFI